MKVNFSFFNDRNRSEHVKEFYLIPTLCLLKSKTSIGYSLRWGFCGFLMIWKAENQK